MSMLCGRCRTADTSRCNRLFVRCLPAPGTRTVAALRHALFVDLRDNLAVAGEQRLGRAHLGAQRQLAFRQTVGAVLLKFLLAEVLFRAAGAERALVHLAARTEVTDLRILRRAERAGVEAVAATNADVLGVQNDGVGSRIERIRR